MVRNTPAFPHHQLICQHERQQCSIRYNDLCCRFSSFRLEWATQWVQITIPPRTEGTAVGGKRAGCPQGRSNLGNIRNDVEEVQ